VSDIEFNYSVSAEAMYFLMVTLALLFPRPLGRNLCISAEAGGRTSDAASDMPATAGIANRWQRRRL